MNTTRRDAYIAGLEWAQAQKANGLTQMPLSKLSSVQEEERPEGLGISWRCDWRDGFVSGAITRLSGEFLITRGSYE